MIGRRSFLAGILAAGVAPAFVPSKILMPVRKIIVPEQMGILTPHEHRKRQAALNQRWAAALSVMAMREGRLERVVSELVEVGDLAVDGGKLRVQLRGGDKIVEAMLVQQIVTGTAILKTEWKP